MHAVFTTWYGNLRAYFAWYALDQRRHITCPADIQFEKKKVVKSIKDAAKRGDTASMKVTSK